MSELKVGSVVLFGLDPEKDRPVAHTTDGKYVMCDYVIPPGYAKIKTIIRDTYGAVFVDAKPVLYDLFIGMKYRTFLRVVDHFGYKIGLDRNIMDPEFKTPQHQVLAYHPENKTAIVFESGGTDKNPTSQHMVSCKIYLPSKYINTSEEMPRAKVLKIALTTNPKEAFDLYRERPLHYTQDTMKKTLETTPTIGWEGADPPNMVHFGDIQNGRSWKKINNEILGKVNPDCIPIFEGCNGYEDIKRMVDGYQKKGIKLYEPIEPDDCISYSGNIELHQ